VDYKMTEQDIPVVDTNELIAQRRAKLADLRKTAEIAPNTITRMRKDQEVTMSVLEKICAVLDADFGDIIEYIKLDELQKMEEQYSAKR